jgi:class 3 adenylate cyclase/ubiquinone/menaquinone biosynthesis C-methylase UbiE
MTTPTTTFLFTDVVGSTERLQSVGDERSHGDLRDHHRRLVQAIRAHDGEHVKWEGDGVMAAFSSATDAIRCAILMQQAAASRGIALRVGLNAGDALKSRDEDYFGIPVVVAARLCASARPQQVLCSAVVVGLLAGNRSFEFREIASLVLKGIETPLPTYELLYEPVPEPHEWTEDESAVYRQLAAIAVPNRQEQFAVMLGLLPFETKESFRVVELACGEGALSYAVLNLFPGSRVRALDISESMRERARLVLAPFGDRATVNEFDLASMDWLEYIDGADVVLCALVLHHLADGAKQRTFGNICARLSDRGVLLLSDIVAAEHIQQIALFGDIYDDIAKRQSLETTGELALYDRFQKNHWNFYRHGLPAQENPAPLLSQLTWLSDAGFEAVDCFWLRAGFAVYGGFKTLGSRVTQDRPTFGEAERSAARGLAAASQAPLQF